MPNQSIFGTDNNIQYPTRNIQPNKEGTMTEARHYDLQDRLIDYAVRIIAELIAILFTSIGTAKKGTER